MRPLKLAVPNKGRLAEDSVRLLRQAGIPLRGSSDRQLYQDTLGGRIKVLYLRAPDIPAFVADGTVDCGITGLDAVRESGVDVEERLDLRFGRCRLVVAVPRGHPALATKDLPDGVRIATSYPALARAHFEAHGRTARFVTVTGACEVTPSLGVADAIADLTSSGSTLLMNHLREVDTILESTCHLITGRGVDAEVADELARLDFALRSVVAAQDKRYLLADVLRDTLDEIRTFLPGVAGPTVVDIAGNPDMVAIQVVVDEDDVFDAVHRLQGLGAKGILIVPIDRLVP